MRRWLSSYVSVRRRLQRTHGPPTMTLKNNLALNEFLPNASMDAGTAPVPPPPASGPRNYQDLDGGFGKEVNFRPARYPSAELGPIGTMVSVETQQGIHLCRLHDV